MTGRSRHLIIFARQPQLGVGKRRLATQVGDVEAVREQVGLLIHVPNTWYMDCLLYTSDAADE